MGQRRHQSATADLGIYLLAFRYVLALLWIAPLGRRE